MTKYEIKRIRAMIDKENALDPITFQSELIHIHLYKALDRIEELEKKLSGWVRSCIELENKLGMAESANELLKKERDNLKEQVCVCVNHAPDRKLVSEFVDRAEKAENRALDFKLDKIRLENELSISESRVQSLFENLSEAERQRDELSGKTKELRERVQELEKVINKAKTTANKFRFRDGEISLGALHSVWRILKDCDKEAGL